MKKAKLSLAWQILIGLVLGIAIGAVLNHFSAEKAWWISNVLQPAGDIFIRLIKMIVIPIVISSLIVGIAGVGDAKSSVVSASKPFFTSKSSPPSPSWWACCSPTCSTQAQAST